MKVYYALYDQSYDNNAQYWTWYPDELTQQMRDSIASKSGAFQMRPKRPNMLESQDIVGGIINYQDQWCVVYRFFNGGNDPQGRPDRCVLATAWVKSEEAIEQNLYELLFCPVFLKIQNQALTQCPVPPPEALEEELNIPIRPDDPQFGIYRANDNIKKWSFKNPEEAEVVGKLFPLLIKEGLQSLQVLQSSAFMETFSGTPLASGVTCVPTAVEDEEPEGLTEQEEQKDAFRIHPKYKFYLGVILTLLLVAVFAKLFELYCLIMIYHKSAPHLPPRAPHGQHAFPPNVPGVIAPVNSDVSEPQTDRAPFPEQQFDLDSPDDPSQDGMPPVNNEQSGFLRR